MSTDIVEKPHDSFTMHWMTWLVLRHFLPSRRLRELIHIIVEQTSGGTITLGHLFEEVHSGTSPWNECWMLRPRSVKGRFESYLQRLVQSLVWQNDDTGWAAPVKQDVLSGIDPQVVDAIVRVGSADFGLPPDAPYELAHASEKLQDGFKKYLDIFRTAQGNLSSSAPAFFWEAITPLLTSFSMPLYALIIKHIADLCADADAWDKTLIGYEKAVAQFSTWDGGEEWRDAANAWRDIALQSKAAAIDIVDTPTAAAKAINGLLSDKTFDTNPLLAANAGLDAFNASAHPRAEGYKAKDSRVAVLFPPLLHVTHDASAAFGYWLQGKHEDASRRFWALLRRQIALGASTELQNTKKWYARSLLEELSDVVKNEVRPSTFHMAIRLLIESTKSHAVARIPWPEDLIDAYVDIECIEIAKSCACKFGESRIHREMVAVGLFRAWATRINPAHRETILAMWRHVASLARDFDASMESSIDLGRPSLEALREIADKNTNLRGDVASEVAEAVLKKLCTEGTFWGKREALITAQTYVDVFDGTSLGKIVEATLVILASEDPAVDRWPLFRPSLDFLTCELVKRYVSDKEDLGHRIVEQILRFGNHEENESLHLLFNLNNFKTSLFQEPSVRSQIQGPLDRIRKQALEINSSNVTANICALLTVPAVSGFDGIDDAFKGLDMVLRSANERVSSIGLTHAYDALLLLVENRAEIEQAVSDHGDWFFTKLDALFRRVLEVWGLATKQPLVFAPFAFPPPTKPSHVIVHNWAYASMRIAEMLGESTSIDEVLARAALNSELRDAIHLAQATRSVARPEEPINLQVIQTDNREAFYLALGRHLARLQKATGDAEIDLCKALVEQCLRFGPKPIDAAVLLAAARLNLHEHVRGLGLSGYTNRMRDDRTLRLALEPIVGLFRVEESTNE
ncbi:MAG: hypothetical protein PHU25_01155 [Deltaproteobacteria bacterium]|nr:hypothetical protein [Deltaproteobacteria bacterium]